MGIDKLRLISTAPPQASFLDEINRDLNTSPPRAQFDLKIGFSEEIFIHRRSRCTIVTRKGVQPGFYLVLNYFAPRQILPLHILELNPNKLPGGYADLEGLLKRVFGTGGVDLKISRIDLNADVQVPVDYLYRTLRIPRKRKSSRYLTKQAGKTSTFSNRGMTGFYIGASPAQLRVYDKREEMKRMKQDVEGLPRIFTRVEWQLRSRKCPVKWVSDLDGLLDVDPFEGIEILGSSEVYDFHNDPKESKKRFLFNKLSKELSAQEASRILNVDRNFKRDFVPLLTSGDEIKGQLQESYRDGIRRFFANQPQLYFGDGATNGEIQ